MRFEVELCNNMSCVDIRHTQEIDQLCDQLIECALSADRVLPRKRTRKRAVCGWNEHIRPYREECQFWFELWQLAGRNDANIYEHMREAKRQYHYAVRRVKRRKKQLQAQKFLDAIVEDRSRDFFAEVKRMSPRATVSPCVNGLEDDQAIAEHFRAKYDALYNDVPSNAAMLERIHEDILRGSRETSYAHAIIRAADVRSAVERLKKGKRDGDKGLVSSHLIHASTLYRERLASLITAMHVHGHQAKSLLNASIISIPKDPNKSLTDDANYRGIALSSSISKCVDVIFLERNKNALETSSLQFAFKEDMGTSLCTLGVKEVVTRYLNRNSPVFSCFLDATKAFDRVRFDYLFQTLIDRRVNWCDLRLLFDLYSRQKVRTSWHDSHSEYFTACNGIRQGSIASPVLFCVYLDGLIDDLEQEGAGCWIGHHYMGAFVYADDITLLSPSVNGLRRMLQVCNQFCSRRGMQFNPTKSVCMKFGDVRTRRYPTIMIDNLALSWVESVKHLGVYLKRDLREDEEIKRKRGDLFGRTNTLLGNFAAMPSTVRQRIFFAKCAHLYGCQTWNLSDRSVSRMRTAFNRCVRRILGLPARTHSVYLPLITNMMPFENMVHSRIRKLIQQMLSSKYPPIKYLSSVCMNDPHSIMSINSGIIENNVPHEYSADEVCTVQAIVDLMYSDTPLNADEARIMLEFLCTSSV